MYYNYYDYDNYDDFDDLEFRQMPTPFTQTTPFLGAASSPYPIPTAPVAPIGPSMQIPFYQLPGGTIPTTPLPYGETPFTSVPGVTPMTQIPGMTQTPGMSQFPAAQQAAEPGVSAGTGGPTFEMEPGSPVQQDINYTQGYLRTQIGRRVKIEFLIGTNMLVDRDGILLGVGISYVLLQEADSDDLLVCDIYSIKFVKIYF